MLGAVELDWIETLYAELLSMKPGVGGLSDPSKTDQLEVDCTARERPAPQPISWGLEVVVLWKPFRRNSPTSNALTSRDQASTKTDSPGYWHQQ